MIKNLFWLAISNSETKPQKNGNDKNLSNNAKQESRNNKRFYQYKDIHKYTWTQNIRNLIIYIIGYLKGGAECRSDHKLLIATMKFRGKTVDYLIYEVSFKNDAGRP